MVFETVEHDELDLVGVADDFIRQDGGQRVELLCFIILSYDVLLQSRHREDFAVFNCADDRSNHFVVFQDCFFVLGLSR